MQLQEAREQLAMEAARSAALQQQMEQQKEAHAVGHSNGDATELRTLNQQVWQLRTRLEAAQQVGRIQSCASAAASSRLCAANAWVYCPVMMQTHAEASTNMLTAMQDVQRANKQSRASQTQIVELQAALKEARSRASNDAMEDASPRWGRQPCG